ncbi:MAG: hypothetical protein EBZ77_09160 [Chitinophagia bacterium]|nr:hypothetical protein [Chitinophagia bacterium]
MAAAAACSFFFSSCTKNPLASALNRALGQKLSLQSQQVDITIPPYGDTALLVNGNCINYYDVDSFIRASTLNLYSMSNIKSVRLTACTMHINNPTKTANFANFKACNGSFFTNSNPAPYNVAILNNPDIYSEDLQLPVDSTVELKDYLSNASQFNYSLGGQLRRKTTDSVHCTVHFTFHIDVE